MVDLGVVRVDIDWKVDRTMFGGVKCLESKQLNTHELTPVNKISLPVDVCRVPSTCNDAVCRSSVPA